MGWHFRYVALHHQRSPSPLGRPREWSRARVREELESFARGSGRMPTARELNMAGRSDLRHAITGTGGVAYWAHEMRLQLRPRQLGEVAEATELVGDARRVIAELGYLPGANKLRQLGLRDLAAAVLASGGSRGYCDHHGLPYCDGRSSPIRARKSSSAA